jgi:hypothetical protein
VLSKSGSVRFGAIFAEPRTGLKVQFGYFPNLKLDLWSGSREVQFGFRNRFELEPQYKNISNCILKNLDITVLKCLWF